MTAAERFLALGDDRGVRDRQPQRMRNSAVTANQSASAPTMAASQPALTKPSQPLRSSVRRKPAAARTSSDVATVRIVRSRERRTASAAGSAPGTDESRVATSEA